MAVAAAAGAEGGFGARCVLDLQHLLRDTSLQRCVLYHMGGRTDVHCARGRSRQWCCWLSSTRSSAVLGAAQQPIYFWVTGARPGFPALTPFAQGSHAAGLYGDGLCAGVVPAAAACVHYPIHCAHIHTFCCVHVKQEHLPFHCASREAGPALCVLCDSNSSLSARTLLLHSARAGPPLAASTAPPPPPPCNAWAQAASDRRPGCTVLLGGWGLCAVRCVFYMHVDCCTVTVREDGCCGTPLLTPAAASCAVWCVGPMPTAAETRRTTAVHKAEAIALAGCCACRHSAASRW